MSVAKTEIPITGQDAEAEAMDAYSRSVVGVAERLSPAVASLRVQRRTRGGRMPAGAGSGVVLTHDGFVLTSAHVVSGRQGTDARRSPTGASCASTSSAATRFPTSRSSEPRTAASRRRSSATPTRCAWGSSSSRSAIPTGSRAR